MPSAGGVSLRAKKPRNALPGTSSTCATTRAAPARSREPGRAASAASARTSATTHSGGPSTMAQKDSGCTTRSPDTSGDSARACSSVSSAAQAESAAAAAAAPPLPPAPGAGASRPM